MRPRSITTRRAGALSSLLYTAGLALLLVTGCDRSETLPGTAESAAESQDAGTPATVINYMERESGVEPYPLRIIVSDAYIRLDDGFDDSDFVLLDRGTRTLYSVTHDNRSVLVINNQPSNQALPDTIQLTEKTIKDADAPAIAGQQAVHWQFLANDQLCFESVSVAGLLPEAVEAMAEFATALGERQLANMHTVPAAMQTPCFLSRYAYRADRLYEHGLPIQEWDNSGFYRSMIDFSPDESIDPAIFNVPGDYVGMSL